MNEFTAVWNEFAAGIARHKFDLQKSAALEKAWDKLTTNPGWLRKR